MRLGTGTASFDIIFGALVCLLVLGITRRKNRIPKGLRLPPGPPGKFIIGNVTDLPRARFWETFDRWAKEYGDLVHIKLLGRSIIFVNSLDVAHDLFDKRSSIYSDRPHSHMVVDLMGWGWNIAIMPYGDWWRRHRIFFNKFFHPNAVAAYHECQTRQTRAFLTRMNDAPTEFMSHVRHLAGAIIMEIVYGIKVLPEGDPYIKIGELASLAGSDAAVPGRYLVEVLPFLKYVPEWMPGAGFRRKAKKWRQIINDMSWMPFMAMKNALDSGTAQPSIAATMLEDLSRQTDAPADEETVIRNVAGVAYAGGADTTVSVISTFIMVMVLYPEVQRKAQAELDAVIGNRLPEFEDLESLPYVNAVCKEVHRWHPAFPLGIGRRVMQDDVYGGYFIPKGAIITGNPWTILHNERFYGPNTNAFEPERFLKPGAIDPVGHFGFGRRICAGQYMADNSIYIAIASILKAFDISHAKDINGDEIPVTPTFNSGLLSQVEPFSCTIKPRSESVRALIQNSAVDGAWHSRA